VRESNPHKQIWSLRSCH